MIETKEEEIYQILNKMIDKIEEAGADVSYFPPECYTAMRETAKEIAQLI